MTVTRRDQAFARPDGDEQVTDQVAMHEESRNPRRHDQKPHDAGQDRAPGIGHIKPHMQFDQEILKRAGLIVARVVVDEALVARQLRPRFPIQMIEGAVGACAALFRVENLGVGGDDLLAPRIAIDADVFQVALGCAFGDDAQMWVHGAQLGQRGAIAIAAGGPSIDLGPKYHGRARDHDHVQDQAQNNA